MTSELKVDKITPASGTNTQIGEAGDTTNLSAGTVTLPTSIITGASEKTTLVDADKFLIADSADSNAFKHVQKSNLGAELNTPAFKAVLSGTQSIPTVTGTIMSLATEQLDKGGCYNNTSGTVTLNGISTPAYSFAPNVEGYYLFVVSGLIYYGNAAGEYGDIYVEKNGSKVIANRNSQSGNMQLSENVRAVGMTHMNGTSDYVKGAIYHQYGTSKDLDSNEDYTYFMGFRITGSV